MYRVMWFLLSFRVFWSIVVFVFFINVLVLIWSLKDIGGFVCSWSVGIGFVLWFGLVSGSSVEVKFENFIFVIKLGVYLVFLEFGLGS